MNNTKQLTERRKNLILLEKYASEVIAILDWRKQLFAEGFVKDYMSDDLMEARAYRDKLIERILDKMEGK